MKEIYVIEKFYPYEGGSWFEVYEDPIDATVALLKGWKNNKIDMHTYKTFTDGNDCGVDSALAEVKENNTPSEMETWRRLHRITINTRRNNDD